jgi:hypothetical protein
VFWKKRKIEKVVVAQVHWQKRLGLTYIPIEGKLNT